jgi:hypothetical protein
MKKQRKKLISNINLEEEKSKLNLSKKYMNIGSNGLA